jgi:hypothetical protein
MTEDPEITEAKSKLHDEILEYENLTYYLSNTEFDTLIPEERLKFNQTKMYAQDLAGLNRGSDIIEIIAKLRKLVENKQALLDPFSECKL